MAFTEAESASVWQPKLRSQITPPAELLYHYVRLFSSQGKILEAWHVLRWFRSAHDIACTTDKLSMLEQCIEKGWLFATVGPMPPSLKGSPSVVTPSVLPTTEGFTPSLDLLYNYLDQIDTMGLTKTCWYLFEWLQMAFSHACKRDMNPYSTGPIATALKLALATSNLVATPKDVPYMQDYVRVRATVGFEDTIVSEIVSDKLWDRLPGRFQMEILEIGRRPNTARDRYGCQLTPDVLACTHGKASPSYTHLLAAGGCDCADREDVPWKDLRSLERAMMEDFANDTQDDCDNSHEATDNDDKTSLVSDMHSDSGDDQDRDTDSAYESESDDENEDKCLDPLNSDQFLPPSPRVQVVNGLHSQSMTEIVHQFENTEKAFITLEEQRIQQMKLWVFKTEPLTRKRSRMEENVSDADDEGDQVATKRRRL